MPIDLTEFDGYPHVQAGLRYALQVVSGEISACLYVKQACQRQLDDLERFDFPYRFNPQLAERPIRFTEKFPHVKGPWAKKKQKLVCEPWWKFIVTTVYGWVDEDDFRRFQEAFILVPRKNGKTTGMAPLGLYGLTADNEYAPEIYCGANSEKQAWELFGIAKKMTERTEQYREQYGVKVNASCLVTPEDGGKFLPVVRDPGDGANPSVSIHDEYHEHKTSSQYDTMKTGMISREQPLTWIISTAGNDTASPCFLKLTECKKILTREVTNEQLFCIVYTIDDDDDWDSEASLAKANPNLGVSINKKTMLAKLAIAKNNPVEQSAFKTKHLNMWVGAYSAWIDIEEFRALADPTLQIESFIGDECVFAFDLALKIDFTCHMILFRRIIAGKAHYYAFPRFYLPIETIQKNPQNPYMMWHKMGYLRAHEGAEIDYGGLERDIIADAHLFSPLELAYDTWGAPQLAQVLRENHGLETVEFGKKGQFFSPAMKEIEVAIAAKRIHYDGNPILTWMMGNMGVKISGTNDERWPNREVKDNKIDGAIALIMAVGRMMKLEPDHLDDWLGASNEAST